MLRAYKGAGRPLPPFSADDVVDFMVTEAVVVKMIHEDNKATEEANRKAAVKQTGVAGHRDPGFLDRARSQEGSA